MGPIRLLLRFHRIILIRVSSGSRVEEFIWGHVEGMSITPYLYSCVQPSEALSLALLVSFTRRIVSRLSLSILREYIDNVLSSSSFRQLDVFLILVKRISLDRYVL